MPVWFEIITVVEDLGRTESALRSEKAIAAAQFEHMSETRRGSATGEFLLTFWTIVTTPATVLFLVIVPGFVSALGFVVQMWSGIWKKLAGNVEVVIVNLSVFVIVLRDKTATAIADFAKTFYCVETGKMVYFAGSRLLAGLAKLSDLLFQMRGQKFSSERVPGLTIELVVLAIVALVSVASVVFDADFEIFLVDSMVSVEFEVASLLV